MKWRQGLSLALISVGLLLLSFSTLQGWVADYHQRREASAFETGQPPGPTAVPVQFFEYLDGFMSSARNVDPTVELPDDGSPELLPGQALPWNRASYPGARLEIPAINLRVQVLFGTDQGTLTRGPGFYTQGAPPDAGGNTGIAAHRSTYGAWFGPLDRLRQGDEIHLDYGGHRYTYVVSRSWVVDPYDWSVMAPTETKSLTLTTCHPFRSDRQRLIVRAELAQVIALQQQG